MRFYIIRHGESIGNLNKICLGHTNLGLTDKGKQQAIVTANALEHVKFAAIYSSDLIRAVETALPHAKMRGLDVGDIFTSKMLRELYFGDWENAAVDYLKNNYGDMFNVAWRQHFGTFTPPNGESVPALADRMYSALSLIAKECYASLIDSDKSSVLLAAKVDPENEQNASYFCGANNTLVKKGNTENGVVFGEENTPKNAEKIDEEKASFNVLVVTHAASIRAFWGKISGYSAEEVCAAVPFPSNASYSIADYDLKSGIFTPVSYSIDDYLSDLKTNLLG